MNRCPACIGLCRWCIAIGIRHSTRPILLPSAANNVLLNAAANRRRFTAAVSDFGLARMCADHSGKHTETVGTGACLAACLPPVRTLWQGAWGNGKLRQS